MGQLLAQKPLNHWDSPRGGLVLTLEGGTNIWFPRSKGRTTESPPFQGGVGGVGGVDRGTARIENPFHAEWYVR